MSRGPVRVVLVSREVYPFEGGGISYYVSSTARDLAPVAEVTILTTAAHEPEYRRLVAAGDPRLPPGVRFEFVAPPRPVPDGADGYYGFFHHYSARVLEALARLYPDGGPEIAEFSDYHAEGAVTVQARHTRDPRLRNTTVCIRAHTTSEMCQVLDGRLNPGFGYRAMFELERYALRHADHVLWPGGDVLGAYRRYYGEDGVASPVRIPNSVYFGADTDPGQAPQGDPAAPLRLLYMGRLERRKGVHNLLSGLLSLDRNDWSLTILGGDTNTGPLGGSIRGLLELESAGDERVRFVDEVSRERLPALIDDHEICVVPSLWECWPNVALEALNRGMPLLATPTGGLTEMVQPGRSGWLTEETSSEGIARTVEGLLGSRTEISALRGSGPREVFAELADAERIRERYLELAERSHRGRSAVKTAAGPAKGASSPLVSVVITYFELERYVEEAVASFLAQTYDDLELIVVNDGSLREQDAVLCELADRYPLTVVTQANSGLPAARNLGVAVSRGAYVLPFDADDIAEPELVERCLAVLEAHPDAAYAATWSSYVDEDGVPLDDGYQPIGNWTGLVDERNVAGAASSLFRREILARFPYDPEFPSYEDWHLFRRLHRTGHYGFVVPQRLFRYRVRRASMLRRTSDAQIQRLRAQMEGHLREAEVEWLAPATSESGR